jgi:hypothetical protein
VIRTNAIVPPVQCTPWCTDGTGHPDVEEPAEQSCHGAEQRIDLAPAAAHLRSSVPSHLLVQLYRDVYPGMGPAPTATVQPPHIEVYSSGTDVLALSLTEARALGVLLIQLADIGSP